MATRPYSIPVSVPNRAPSSGATPLNQPVNVGSFPAGTVPSSPTPITPVRGK